MTDRNSDDSQEIKRGENRVGEYMKSLLTKNSKTGSDFTFTDPSGETMYAHKVMLRQIPYFRTMFDSNFSHQPPVYQIESIEHVRPIIEFVYGFTVDVSSPEEIVRMCEMANYWQFDDFYRIAFNIVDANFKKIASKDCLNLAKLWLLPFISEDFDMKKAFVDYLARVFSDLPDKIIDMPLFEVLEPSDRLKFVIKCHRLDRLNDYVSMIDGKLVRENLDFFSKIMSDEQISALCVTRRYHDNIFIDSVYPDVKIRHHKCLGSIHGVNKKHKTVLIRPDVKIRPDTAVIVKSGYYCTNAKDTIKTISRNGENVDIAYPGIEYSIVLSDVYKKHTNIYTSRQLIHHNTDAGRDSK
jgi:BTB/POZ domain